MAMGLCSCTSFCSCNLLEPTYVPQQYLTGSTNYYADYTYRTHYIKLTKDEYDRMQQENRYLQNKVNCMRDHIRMLEYRAYSSRDHLSLSISKEPPMTNVLKMLLSPEDRLLSKYVFSQDGNLNMNSELLQKAILTFPKFKEHLVEVVKNHDKEVKKKNK